MQIKNYRTSTFSRWKHFFLCFLHSFGSGFFFFNYGISVLFYLHLFINFFFFCNFHTSLITWRFHVSDQLSSIWIIHRTNPRIDQKLRNYKMYDWSSGRNLFGILRITICSEDRWECKKKFKNLNIKKQQPQNKANLWELLEKRKNTRRYSKIEILESYSAWKTRNNLIISFFRLWCLKANYGRKFIINNHIFIKKSTKKQTHQTKPPHMANDQHVIWSVGWI